MRGALISINIFNTNLLDLFQLKRDRLFSRARRGGGQLFRRCGWRYGGLPRIALSGGLHLG